MRNNSAIWVMRLINRVNHRMIWLDGYIYIYMYLYIEESSNASFATNGAPCRSSSACNSTVAGRKTTHWTPVLLLYTILQIWLNHIVHCINATIARVISHHDREKRLCFRPSCGMTLNRQWNKTSTIIYYDVIQLSWSLPTLISVD